MFLIYPRLLAKKGTLVPSQKKIKPGDTQQFFFAANDDRPFWMTPTMRQNRRFDVKRRNKKTKICSDHKILSQIKSKMPSMQVKDLENKPREDLERLEAGLDIPLLVEIKEVETKG